MGQQQKFSWFLVACRSNEKNICMDLNIIFFAVYLQATKNQLNLLSHNYLWNVIKQCRVYKIEKRFEKAI